MLNPMFDPAQLLASLKPGAATRASDLQPDNALARYLREEGHTVFMLSWRNVGSEQGHLT